MERVTEYFSQLLEVIRESHWIVNEDLTLREIDLTEGYVRGILYLYGGFTLHASQNILKSKKGYQIAPNTDFNFKIIMVCWLDDGIMLPTIIKSQLIQTIVTLPTIGSIHHQRWIFPSSYLI